MTFMLRLAAGALSVFILAGLAAPARLIASGGTAPGGPRTRPLCPHPQVARWSGNGSSDDAANFQCVTPRR